MTQIKISDGVTTITMPRTRNVSDAGAVEYREITMAGGKTVREMIGFRPGFSYTWDYVPADTVRALADLLRTGKFLTVEYFDLDGNDKIGVFSVSYPAPKVFAFRNGVAVWHDFTLTIKAQEVVR